jgi:hypothetical protein
VSAVAPCTATQTRQAQEDQRSQGETLERREMEALLARDEARRERRRLALAELAAKGQAPGGHWRAAA